MDGKPTHIPLKLCNFCSMHNISQCPEVTLKEGFRFRLCLGQAPDLGSCRKIEGSSIRDGNIRQILESCVSDSRTGELLHLDLEVVQPEGSNSDSITLEVQVDRVVLPPQCDRKFPSIESEFKDARDITTNDWNPDLQISWFERALKLKERGSQIIHAHSSNVNGRNLDLQKWSAAFSFYSRAFQLILLANLANETCNTVKNYGIRSTNRVIHSRDISYFDLNEFPPSEDLPKSNGVKPKQLEFNLLLNLALCQLKAGVTEFCAQNCSQALNLDPGWVDFNSSTDLKSLTSRAVEIGIGYADICKALYRRSQAYFAMGKLDETRTDLETSLRIIKYRNAGKSDPSDYQILSATESLLSRVLERLSKDKALLASRLRNRENLFS